MFSESPQAGMFTGSTPIMTRPSNMRPSPDSILISIQSEVLHERTADSEVLGCARQCGLAFMI